jgi:hypothetical protein
MISSPFKFLDSYTKDDASIFFGRESEATRAPLNPLKGKSQRAVRAENQQRHYDERSEEVAAARSASSAQLIWFKLFKLLTDSFVALAMTFSNCLCTPLTPSRGNFQRAFQKLSEPAGKLAPLGVRGCDGISCKTFPIPRSQSQLPMAKSQKQYNNIAI